MQASYLTIAVRGQSLSKVPFNREFHLWELLRRMHSPGSPPMRTLDPDPRLRDIILPSNPYAHERPLPVRASLAQTSRL